MWSNRYIDQILRGSVEGSRKTSWQHHVEWPGTNMVEPGQATVDTFIQTLTFLNGHGIYLIVIVSDLTSHHNVHVWVYAHACLFTWPHISCLVTYLLRLALPYLTPFPLRSWSDKCTSPPLPSRPDEATHTNTKLGTDLKAWKFNITKLSGIDVS